MRKIKTTFWLIDWLKLKFCFSFSKNHPIWEESSEEIHNTLPSQNGLSWRMDEWWCWLKPVTGSRPRPSSGSFKKGKKNPSIWSMHVKFDISSWLITEPFLVHAFPMTLVRAKCANLKKVSAVVTDNGSNMVAGFKNHMELVYIVPLNSPTEICPRTIRSIQLVYR